MSHVLQIVGFVLYLMFLATVLDISNFSSIETLVKTCLVLCLFSSNMHVLHLMFMFAVSHCFIQMPSNNSIRKQIETLQVSWVDLTELNTTLFPVSVTSFFLCQLLHCMHSFRYASSIIKEGQPTATAFFRRFKIKKKKFSFISFERQKIQY